LIDWCSFWISKTKTLGMNIHSTFTFKCLSRRTLKIISKESNVQVCPVFGGHLLFQINVSLNRRTFISYLNSFFNGVREKSLSGVIDTFSSPY
jgi:hypothetical protein